MADSLALQSFPGVSSNRRAPVKKLRSPNRLFLWFVLLIPIVWVLGLAPVVAFCFAALFFRYRSRARAPEVALLAIGAAFLVSMAVAASNGEPTDRLLAAGYNVVVLVCACCAFNFGRQVDLTFARTPSLRTPAIAFFFAYAAAIAVAYAAGAPSAEEEIAFPSLVTSHLGDDLPGLLGSYATARVTGADWSSGSVAPRPLAFGVYFNEGALMFLLSGILALLASRSRLITYAVVICIAVGLVTLGSRMLIVASLLASIVALIARAPGSTEVRLAIAFVTLFAAIATFVIRPDQVDLAVDQIVTSREGSSAARFLSYSVALETTWRESPIVGLGVKPRDESLLGIPIGSHSTVVSVFTKGGIVAVIPLLIFYICVIIASARLLFLNSSARVYRNAQAALGATALIVLSWMLVQDFDAPIYGTMMAFVFLGSAFGLLERLHRYNRIREQAVLMGRRGVAHFV